MNSDGTVDGTVDGTANRLVPAVRAVLTRPMEATDWPGVSEIYAAGIATGNATFDTAPPAARAGFRVVGLRERLGRHHGHWRDVILLERRSSAVGVAWSTG